MQLDARNQEVKQAMYPLYFYKETHIDYIEC